MTTSMFIDGDWVATASGAPDVTHDQIERTLATAVRGAEIMRAMPLDTRRSLLERIAIGLDGAVEEMALAIVAGMGKPISEARGEAGRAGGVFRLAAAELIRPEGEVLALDAMPLGGQKLGLTLRSPVGVVLAITPFNYPVILVAHKLAPAIAAGNAVILKPASLTPAAASVIVRVMLESGTPPEAIQCIIGPGYTLGRALAQDPRVRKISLTGSTAAGEAITKVAGIKRISLELGGCAPVLVTAQADLDVAARALAATGYSNAGQACTSAQRVIVDDSVADAFVERLLESVRGIRMGPANDAQTQLAGLVTETEAQRVESMVAASVGAGASLVLGGDRDGVQLTPTVVDHVRPGMPLFDLELFGPAVGIVRAHGLEEAIRLANASPYGLSAAVFTRDVSTAIHCARAIDSGNVMINWGPLWRSDLMPYGGLKASGVGKEGVRFAMDEMSEMKTVIFHGIEV
jgi:acyl-CoA reductase-like NAD-dependent aldehyde dehydrogenase